MSGHRHNPSAGTQNQGNTLGDRSCVRQSKLYRQYESGNGVKDILGSSHLRWDADYKEGAYKGQRVFDHNAPNTVSNNEAVDPRYQAQDMKNKLSNASASYSRPPVDRQQSLTKYDDPRDRSVNNIGNYQNTTRNQFRDDESNFRSSRTRHDIPEPIETTYKSLRAQKNKDDDRHREQGRGYQEDSNSLAKYQQSGRNNNSYENNYSERMNYRAPEPDANDNYNKYSDRNYGRGNAASSYDDDEEENYNKYSDRNKGGRTNNYRDQNEDDNAYYGSISNKNGRGGGGSNYNNAPEPYTSGRGAAVNPGNKSTRPW